MSANRGFSVSHQKVALNVSFGGIISGYTELAIVPTRSNLKTLYLNCARCNISAVSVNGKQVPYNLLTLNPSIPLSISQNAPATSSAQNQSLQSHVHHFPALKRSMFTTANEAEEGELRIGGIDEFVKPIWKGEDAVGKKEEYAQIDVVITYDVREGKGEGRKEDGVMWFRPGERGEGDDCVPHICTTSQNPTSARCWVPSIDTLHDRCTWDLEFVVPKSIVSSLSDEDEGSEEVEEFPVLVIASGELIERIQHPSDESKSIFYYSLSSPSSVQHLQWAVGPFQGVDLVKGKLIGNNPQSVVNAASESFARQNPNNSNEENDSLPALHAFCLPGRELELLNTTMFLRSCLSFYIQEFGSYPFSSYTVLFLSTVTNPVTHSSTLTILSSDYLTPNTVIDQVYESRQVLAHALITQWVGINIIQKAWSDTWLINGLGLYIAGLWLRESFGVNEWRFRLKKDIQRCTAQDVTMPPLSVPGSMGPPTEELLLFINLKSPLVLWSLDKLLRKSGTSLGLSRVIPKIFLGAISGELGNNTNLLSTNGFLKSCRKICGVSSGGGIDLKTFSEQWIFKNGCPHFKIETTFNRKKMAVEVHVQQEIQAWTYFNSAPWEERVTLRPVKCFEGQMTIRIHEADGTAYEHVIDIRERSKVHNLPFNSKYRRVGRSRGLGIGMGIGGEAGAVKRLKVKQGDKDEEEIEVTTGGVDGMGDLSFEIYQPWETDPRQKKKWRVEDFKDLSGVDEDVEPQEGAITKKNWEWIRADSEFEWIAVVNLEQPDYMWCSMLGRDRDVVAQLDAILALTRCPSAIVSSHLCKTVLVSNYFVRIRMEAANALFFCAQQKFNFIGLFHLFKIFLTWFCYEDEEEGKLKNSKDPFDFILVPRANNFTNFTMYFLKKALISSIARIRDDVGQPYPKILSFLTDQLAYNDNSFNPYSDSHYLSHLINTLSSSFIHQTDTLPAAATPIFHRADQEVDRLMKMDKLVPSFHNILTISGLEWKVKMTMAGLVDVDMLYFLQYTREGNYPPVRATAFDALLLLRAIGERYIARYLFAVLLHDASLVVRRRLAQSLLESIAALTLMDDYAGPTPPEEAPPHGRLKPDRVIKQLRKEIGKSVMFRESLLAALSNTELDSQVRWCLLKVSEILFKPEEEPLPKLKFKLPLQSVPEPVVREPTPPPVPRPTIKIQIPLRTTAGPPPANISASAFPPVSISPTVPEYPSSELLPPASSAAKLIIRPPKIPKPPKTDGTPKNPPRQQASGLSFQDFKACQSMLKKLIAAKKSTIFRNPVDPIKDMAPNYFQIIKKPMDLSTMSQKLDQGQYKDRDAFKDDFKLMISNCHTYNASTSKAYKLGQSLDLMFDKSWDRTLSTLQTMKKDDVSLPAMEAIPEDEEELDLVSVPQPSPVKPESGVVATQTKVKLKLKPAVVKSAAESNLLPTVATDSDAARAMPILHIGPPPKKRKASAADLTDPPFKKKGRPKKDKERARGVEIVALPTPVHDPSTSGGSTGAGESPPTQEFVPVSIIPPKPTTKPSAKLTHNIPPYIPAMDLTPPDHETTRRAASPLSSLSPPNSVVDPPASSSKQMNGHASSSKKPRGNSFLIPSELVREVCNVKKVKPIMKKMVDSPDSLWFRLPVDRNIPGCETYYDEIKHPMDLATMQSKLDKQEYRTYGDVDRDFRQIIENCKIFNPAGTAPVLSVDNLASQWQKEWQKANTLTYMEKRSLGAMLTKLEKQGAAFPFRVAVDPIALQIPQYFDIIPRKDARDLSLIRKNLEADRYHNFDELEADVKLMLKNCYTFNPVGTPVYESGREFEKLFDDALKTVKANFGVEDKKKGKKREAPDGSGNKSKKVKLI